MIAEFLASFLIEAVTFSALALAALIWLTLRLKRAKEDQTEPN
jgi:hypothetical protein